MYFTTIVTQLLEPFTLLFLFTHTHIHTYTKVVRKSISSVWVSLIHEGGL